MSQPKTRPAAIAWRIETPGLVDSTNDLALRRARGGEPEGLVICADSQRKGRGRLGRSWFSAPGCGLYFSVLLRPPLPRENLATISLVVAVAIAEGLSAAGGYKIDLKWPNDLRIGGKKVGGILLEYEPKGSGIPAVVVGIGINFQSPPGGFPDDFAARATSLEDAGSRILDGANLIQTLLASLSDCYREFTSTGFEPFRQKWEALSDGLGKRAEVSVADGAFEGTMRGIDASGRLLLEMSSGEMRTIDAGEVIER